MKKLSYIILGLVLIGGLESCNYKSFLFVLKPPKPYAKTEIPLAPDYTQEEHWHIANPRDNKKQADVFFIHPTTYIKGKLWNQDLSDAHVNFRTRTLSLQFQASIFYQDYRMFAPKYRQAAFYSFVDKKDNGEQALELAYQDVKKSFLYYWNEYNRGRPFILASHSQGSYHALRLMSELQGDSIFQSQLIAAYTVGWPIPAKYFEENKELAPCTSSTQTGCLVGWNVESGRPKLSLVKEMYPQDSIFCVNPLSWNTECTYVSKNKNLGSLQRNQDKNKAEIILYYCDAQINDGTIKITPPANQKELQMPMGKGNYHLYDYTFFYENVRQNAKARTGEFLKEKQKNSNK